MIVTRGQPQRAVGSKPNASTVMRPGAAERMIRGFHLVRHVIHDVRPVRNFRKVFVHFETHQPVRVRIGHVRRRIDIDAAVFRKIRVDRDALHTGLPLTEKIVCSAWVIFAVGHAQ